MVFNSVSYLLFFPIAVLLYFAFPKKLKNTWLLIASYYFYMCWNAEYALLLAGFTLVTFGSSLLVSRFRGSGRVKAAKGAMAVSLFLNIGILFIFKYSGFMAENVNRIMGVLGQDMKLSGFDVLLPVGISFYIFQALGYTVDVYRGDIEPTKNICKYALFVSFFPQLVAGPIERSVNLFPQFEEEHVFEVDRARSGLLTMLWGLFIKMVIADNLSGIVTQVYENYLAYTGVEILFATALFAFQIYCDFSGYSYIAIGSARVLGFRLMDNFASPYLAGSVNEFWKRWHISLTSWFRDYLYIPLGGNRKGDVRKYINILIVFLVSGLWHGASFTYVVWGGLNGLYLVTERICRPYYHRVLETLNVNTKRFSYRLFSCIGTFVLVDISWMFFRAETFSQVWGMLRQIKANFGFRYLFGQAITNVQMEPACFLALVFAFLLLTVVDVLRDQGKDVVKLVLMQGALFRYGVYLLLLLMIMFFGIYGYEYAQTAFIYFQF